MVGIRYATVVIFGCPFSTFFSLFPDLQNKHGQPAQHVPFSMKILSLLCLFFADKIRVQLKIYFTLLALSGLKNCQDIF
jgi:hypothetical protein